MQNADTDVMCFNIAAWAVEKNWTKRDAFILMDCDDKKYTHTTQRFASYLMLKKSSYSVALIDEWLEYAQDPRIITDMPNQLGKENYEGFRENRHDQTIWSLLTKKKGITPLKKPAIFCHHRRNLHNDRILPLTPNIIAVMKRVETDKELIPEKFRYGLPQVVKANLANLIGLYIEKTITSELPANLPPVQEILDSSRELNLPETPLLKEALSKMSTTLEKSL